MTRTFCTGLMCALVCVSAPPARAQSAPPAVPLFDNLGSHRYAIRTRVPLAQRYFDQGLRLYYGFNHAESIRSFVVLPVDWTVESGLLTPSLKMKRSVLMKEFAADVEKLYAG